MGFGFIIKKIKGSKCRDRSRCSHEETGVIFDMKWGKELFFVLLSISREYTAPNTVARDTMGKERVFQSIMAEIMSSSPRRLGVGGSPRLDTQVIIHQRVRRGVISLNPREMARVRVFFRS